MLSVGFLNKYIIKKKKERNGNMFETAYISAGRVFTHEKQEVCNTSSTQVFRRALG